MILAATEIVRELSQAGLLELGSQFRRIQLLNPRNRASPSRK
jgi:hypothetical protein